MRRPLFCPFVPVTLLTASLVMSTAPSRAQEKITFTDHVLPLVEQHCAKCHNPDKKKGDLDLTSYSGALKGGGSGVVIVAGNVDSSKLIKSLTHAEEPNMPPNKPPLPEKELAVFRKWIAGGLLETSGSKAVVAARPSVDLTLKVSNLGKPDGPPPMPKELSIEPVVHAKRAYAVNGLAASPWAPLVAITGQKQVLLYNTTNLDLLGILPFSEGQPWDVKFSQSGRLLLAAGGHGAKSGNVTLWNVESGERIATIGKEYDVVIAADISPDQARVALGGPDRLVKIFSTKTGEVEHKIKKHTDWVTALAFSPNGEMLASGDRNGGLTVWDADSGQELFTTAGHKGAVTSLSWRTDSKLVASSSEDGTVKLWESGEGRQSKTWNAHGGGVLCVAYSRDGKFVTCGRDGTVATWSADGAKLKSLDFAGEVALRCAWSEDQARVVASDYAGNVFVWDVKSGKKLGSLDANPKMLAERVADAQARITEIQARGDKPSPLLSDASHELAGAESALGKARTDADKALVDFTAGAAEVARLKDAAAKPGPAADIETQLTAARAAREKARTWRTEATNEVATLSLKLSVNKSKFEELRKTQDSAAELVLAQAELEKLKRAQAMVQKLAPRQQTKR